MDTLLLSRIQFGLTTAFHIIFPTLTIGLAVYLVAVEALWLRTKNELYYRMYRFWVKIFAIHFAVGVVTGITLEFEFGTNFAVFSQKVANIIAPMMAYEGIMFFSAYLGLQSGIYPFAVLPDLTIHQAASQPETQMFTLIGALTVLPFVLGYTIYSYWVFRGKVSEDEAGYH